MSDAQGRIVRGADGELYIDGAHKAHLARLMRSLRSTPVDASMMGPNFKPTIGALEQAMASPAPLRLAMYYTLSAGVERAMAEAFGSLANAAPPDEVTAQILATQLVALARADVFEQFAKFLDDESAALEFLMRESRATSELRRTLAGDGKHVDPEDAAVLAAGYRTFVKAISLHDPEGVLVLTSFADGLSAKAPMPLLRYFETQPEIDTLVAKSCLTLALMAGPGKDADALHAIAERHAKRAAAAAFIPGFFAPRAEGEPFVLQ